MPIQQQVSERLKEVPAIALRAVFAGIGQLLLAAEKVRNAVAEQVSRPEQAPRAAPQPSRRPQETGNVRLIREEGGFAHPGAPQTTPAKFPTPREATAAQPAPEPAAPGPATAGSGPATPVPATPEPAVAAASPAAGRPGVTPPIPNYDELSLASLRARLRVLDAPTVHALLAYERANAGREAVIAMFERRLTKIEPADD
jgi:hypothetical protein